MKQDSVTFNHGKIVNIYIVYEISKSINISYSPKLENFLFGEVGLTKSSDIDKNKYCEYGIGFHRHGSFSSPGIGLGRNIIIFGVNMNHQQRLITGKKIFWFWVKDQHMD